MQNPKQNLRKVRPFFRHHRLRTLAQRDLVGVYSELCFKSCENCGSVGRVGKLGSLVYKVKLFISLD